LRARLIVLADASTPASFPSFVHDSLRPSQPFRNIAIRRRTSCLSSFGGRPGREWVRRGWGDRFHLETVGRGTPVLRETSLALRPVSSKVRTRTRAGVSHSGFFWWVFLGVVGMVRVMLLRCRGRCYADCSSLLPPASYILHRCTESQNQKLLGLRKTKVFGLCAKQKPPALRSAHKIKSVWPFAKPKPARKTKPANTVLTPSEVSPPAPIAGGIHLPQLHPP
jgi:hypothetical protein